MSRGTIVVAGAGLAGFAAAVQLAAAGRNIILLESSGKGGGRAYSFPHSFSSFPENKHFLDNGQHILLGCYHETFKYLKTIGTYQLLKTQEKMEVNMVNRDRKKFLLRSGSLPYPLDLLQALLGFDYLSLAQKLRAIMFILKLRFIDSNKLNDITVADWLRSEGQTGELFSGIWDILCTGAMNSSAEKASAGIFAHILKVIFLEGKENSRIVVPGTDLSTLFVENGVKFIEEMGGEVRFSEPIEAIEITAGKVIAVETRGCRIERPDGLIMAMPAHAVKKVRGLEGVIRKMEGYEMEYSSITSFHLRIQNYTLPHDFVALIDSPVQWVFNHGDYISTVTSASTDWDGMKEEDILQLIKTELSKYLGITGDNILSHKMIKEKRATFICGGENLKHRPGTETSIKNLFLAGDWTATGLPATIEGAILSGHSAANSALKL